MQNIDFYSGKTLRETPSGFSREDPEFFSNMANIHTRDEEKNMKKATRMLFLIVALCIVSFTAGLVIGIKFTAGSNKEIVDSHTKKAVDDIGKKVSDMLKDSATTDLNAAPMGRDIFSKEEFPYAIKINGEYSQPMSQDIAGFLSGRGQTVILAKNNEKYRIFVGPFKDADEAADNLKKIKTYSGEEFITRAVIIKR
ncbi:MAG: SPOR domain-containing protein [Spirochaetes bacterium]|jgi:preprotein translocase subunit SecF|nr:SPOR domain-containing protein [Spirochaetota bacterium]